MVPLYRQVCDGELAVVRAAMASSTIASSVIGVGHPASVSSTSLKRAPVRSVAVARRT
jgi:hypothetical protein